MLGVVLTGGRGRRMGGLDKGLQPLHGIPLALLAAHKLQQQSLPVDHIALVANRNLDTYQSWGFEVIGDMSPDFAGPLAGMQAGLKFALARGMDWVVTVPCDTPYFPTDLVQRMVTLANGKNPVPIYVQAPDATAADRHQLRAHPVFSLLHVSQLSSLEGHLRAGQRKLMQWMGDAHGVPVNFDLARDIPSAFANLNTLEALRLQDAITD